MVLNCVLNEELNTQNVSNPLFTDSSIQKYLREREAVV